MQTIAVINHKGGSAKTTTTVNLGAALAKRGRRVLIIDMDPQGSASAWLGVPDAPATVIRAIEGEAELAELVCETTAPGVQLVPSSPTLMVSAGQGESDVALGFIRAMERLPARWDIVLVDCAPSLGYLSVAPLSVCQGILIPVEAHVLGVGSLASIVALTERVRDKLNPGLRIDGILACRVSRTAHSRQVAERIGTTHPGLVLRTQIRESTRLAEAPAVQLPISRYAPGSTGDDDYQAAADELLERLDLAARSRIPASKPRSARSRVADTLRSRPRVRRSPVQPGPIEPRTDASSGND